MLWTLCLLPWKSLSADVEGWTFVATCLVPTHEKANRKMELVHLNNGKLFLLPACKLYGLSEDGYTLRFSKVSFILYCVSLLLLLEMHC